MAASDDIGDFLRKQRKRRRWSQETVASRNGWHQTKLSKIETGVNLPSADDMEALSKMYGVSLVRLVRLRARAA